MTGTVLTWMQDRDAEGMILIGPPGTAKSLVGAAAGNTGGIPTIAFDLGAMKSGIYGFPAALHVFILKECQNTRS
jgi:SpoVK/Ycf46/Vps4 family AAA+-type ATPase